MSNAEGQGDAFQAIIRIVKDQKALEKHQRAKKASVSTIQDSMVYAYDKIVEVLQPYMDDEP